MIATLFPVDVMTATRTDARGVAPLLPEEAACVRRAVPKRRREFALGRACARDALAQLGITGVPVAAGADRAPVWPAGVVGSLSHCDGLCAAAVARAGTAVSLGLDVEPATPLPSDLVRRVCTPAEIARIGTAEPLPAGDWYKLFFSAKESVYKAWYPLAHRGLDFLDVELRVDADAASFTARMSAENAHALPDGSVLQGRFTLTSSHFLTAATVTREAWSGAR